MTIDDVYEKLNSFFNDRLNSSSYNKACISRLQAIVVRLKNLTENSATTNVDNKIAKCISKFSLNKENLILIENWLADIEEITDRAISGVSKNPTGDSKDKKSKSGKKFVDFVPAIIAVMVLVLGLSLGLTVFNENQDALYFAFESIKDIVASVVSGLFVEQCVRYKSGKKNNITIVILSSIFGMTALVFSVVLWVGSDISIIERFTPWDKLTYLWVGLTLIFITIISAVSVVWFLLTYPKKKGKR